VLILSNWAFLFPDIAWAAGTEIVVREVGGAPETQTTVSGGPGEFDVHTSTIHSQTQTALNSFSRFNVGDVDTVNLYIPDDAQNLLNLVYDEPSSILGTLNSYKEGRPGVIDGNVYFLNPHGVLIGTDGVVNVGALSIVTPTTEFMTGFLTIPIRRFQTPSRERFQLTAKAP
jgi:filamentous hemagglutinin family protein